MTVGAGLEFGRSIRKVANRVKNDVKHEELQFLGCTLRVWPPAISLHF